MAVALLLCALASSAEAQAFSATDRFGLWVIAPDRATRRWASEWIETSLRATPSHPDRPILPWRDVLNELLDSHELDPVLGPRPPGGPSARLIEEGDWPWPMSIEVPLEEMIEILYGGRMGVVVQVVVEKSARDVSASSDSIYVLSAIAISRGTVGASSKRPIVRTSTTRSLESSSLQDASVKLGVRLAEIWADLLATVPARAR